MVDVLVVAAVVGGPVQAGVLKGAGTKNKGEKFYRGLRFEGEVGEKAVITDRDAHHRRAKIEEEHTELEPIDSEMVEIDGRADEGDEGGANEETGGDPVHAVEWDTKHNVYGFTFTSSGHFREMTRTELAFLITRNQPLGKERFFAKTPQILRFRYGT